MTDALTLIEEGIEAFRLTRDYVGEDLLPAIEGWTWFDWTEKARRALDRPDASLVAATPPSPAPGLPLDARLMSEAIQAVSIWKDDLAFLKVWADREARDIIAAYEVARRRAGEHTEAALPCMVSIAGSLGSGVLIPGVAYRVAEVREHWEPSGIEGKSPTVSTVVIFHPVAADVATEEAGR